MSKTIIEFGYGQNTKEPYIRIKLNNETIRYLESAIEAYKLKKRKGLE